MSQLLATGINTIDLTNSFLRNWRDLNEPQLVFLRVEQFNNPEFAKFDIFKSLCLDLARRINTEIITDIVILALKPGEDATLKDAKNRLILALENQSSFSAGDRRYIPEPGQLIWTNEDITIENTSQNISILLVLDCKEFLL